MTSQKTSARVCGVRVDFIEMDCAVEQVAAAAVAQVPISVHFVNAYTLSLAMSDTTYAERLNGDDLNLPDGRPLVWAARAFGIAGAEQVCGPDVVPRLFARDGLEHYLYGSTPSTLNRLETRLRARYPAARIAGRESPPFQPLTSSQEARVVDRIRSSGANIVWVGLGTPKQDEFVSRMATRIGVPVLAVGAAFDFHAGTKTRAPAWITRAGLEWAHRLGSEPRRLARRYVVGNAKFLVGLVKGGVRVQR